MSAVSAEFFDEGVGRVGAAITDRRTYDVSDAWGGSGPIPEHSTIRGDPPDPDTVPAGDPTYTFVTDGIEKAVEQAKTAAAANDVFLQGASIVQQCLRAGLMDELVISLVPHPTHPSIAAIRAERARFEADLQRSPTRVWRW